MDFNKKQRFSIRKFKVGVCSVLLVTLLVGVALATLVSQVAVEEKVLHADDSPDITLNKVVHEKGYIEWNYLFNARKERNASSGF